MALRHAVPFNAEMVERSALLAPTMSGATEHERLVALEALRDVCARPFDADRADHVNTLKDVWYAAFPGHEFTRPSEKWKELGFQGTDPLTDLRGAGFLGLQHYHALLLQHGLDLSNLADEMPPELKALPLSIASVNVTAMLLSYLQLAPSLTCAFMPGGRLECDDATLHAFLTLGWEGCLEASGDDASDATDASVRRLAYALTALHSRLVSHLGRTWTAMSARPGTTLMDFPKALRATYAVMRRALDAGPAAHAAGPAPWRLERVVLALESAEWAEPLEEPPAASGFVECLEPLSAAVSKLVVRPTAWALRGAAAVVVGVVGLCWAEA